MKSTPEYGFQYPEGPDLLETYPVLAKSNAEKLEASLKESTWWRGNIPGSVSSLDSLSLGGWGLPSGSQALSLGLPASAVYTLNISQTGNVKTVLAIKRADVNGPPRIYTASASGGTWSDWVEQASMKDAWYQGRLASGSADDAPDGMVTVWGGSDATALGLPASTYGTLFTVRYGAQGWQNFHALGVFPDQVWHRRLRSSGWDEWEEKGGGVSTPHSRGSITPAGLKIVPMPITVGKGSSAGAPAAGSYRIPLNFNAPITRWRVCFSVRAPRYTKIHSTSATITELAIGFHAGGGHFTGAPRRVLRDLVVPTNGDPGVTPWQSTPIGDGADMLLAYTYESTGSETPPQNYGASWSAGSATAVEVTPDTTYTPNAIFDIWIEAETYATTPVIAAIGDSLVCGANATLAVHDAWANVYARDLGGLATLYGTSGDSGYQWVRDEDEYKVARFDKPHLAAPDAVIWAMGRNDFNNSQTVAQMQDTTVAAADIITRRIGQAMYATTITPRDSGLGDVDRAVYNNWLISEGHLFRDVFDFSSVVAAPSGGILPEFNADGLHLNSAGYEALSEAITRPITAPPVKYAS